jgi:DNA-binding MarR family transcriptional regulator
VNDIIGPGLRVQARPGPAAGQEGQPRAAQPAAADLLAAVSAVRRTARRAVRLAWAQQPLPPAQSELLRLAAAQPGLSVAEAARELRLAPNTVSTLVGRLAEQGLLHRGRGAADGRTALLTVTGKARRRIAEWRDLRSELAGRAFDRLPPADQQALIQAVPALLRLAEQMEAT